MRKPRDFDSELQALTDKAKRLKERRTRQLGELVEATGADALDVETLAGAMLALVDADDPARKESWRKRGQAFFQGRTRRTGAGTGASGPSVPPGGGGAASA